MIDSNCIIKPAAKPENGLKLCWNINCRRPRPKGKVKWCERCVYGNDYYTQHHIGSSRLIVKRAACMEMNDEHQKYSFMDTTWYAMDDCWVECSMCHSVTNNPEVDHMVPMNGDDRGGEDCRHHTSNLRVLCHDCHSEVSAIQSKARAAAKRGSPQMSMQL